MRIYKCDRCGREVDYLITGELYELCEDCSSELDEVIENFIDKYPKSESHDNAGKWKSNDIIPEYTNDDGSLVTHHGTKLLSAKIKLKDSIVTLIGSYWGVVLDDGDKDYQYHYFIPYKVEQGKEPGTFVANRNWNRLINWDNVIEWDYLDLA